MIYVDLALGDLGYSEGRVVYKYCGEPQARGLYNIKVYITINGHELEIYNQLRAAAKQHVVNEIYRSIESEPPGAA